MIPLTRAIPERIRGGFFDDAMYKSTFTLLTLYLLTLTATISPVFSLRISCNIICQSYVDARSVESFFFLLYWLVGYWCLTSLNIAQMISNEFLYTLRVNREELSTENTNIASVILITTLQAESDQVFL